MGAKIPKTVSRAGKRYSRTGGTNPSGLKKDVAVAFAKQQRIMNNLGAVVRKFNGKYHVFTRRK